MTDYRESTTRLISTPQGRLYSVLWKGDLRFLDATTAAPACPKMSGELRSELESAASVIKQRHFAKPSSGYAFLTAVDDSRRCRC